MDSLRGFFSGVDPLADDEEFDPADEVMPPQTPPPSIGTDERRMQVRAYNHWASLLGKRQYPDIEDLDPESLDDFGPYSVLLDFGAGIENPAIQFLGGELARECGADDSIEWLDDVPSRSLLSRITDHYMQILANQAPIGFEAEFVNQRGRTVAYRGILLPFSSDDDTIDFIYGVINWKELADQATTDHLMAQVDEVLDLSDEAIVPAIAVAVDTETEAKATEGALPAPVFGRLNNDIGPFAWSTMASDDDDDDAPAAWSLPVEDAADGSEPEVIDQPKIEPTAIEPIAIEATAIDEPVTVPSSRDPLAAEPSMVEPVVEAEEPLALSLDSVVNNFESAEEQGLADLLASARELALDVEGNEERTRTALYAAVGRAYDFALAAEENPGDFHELLSDAGLTMQDRAPMTPIVKLVFGAEYDKTRLTEYAAVLSHARRIALPAGHLGGFLASVPGGLKAVVQAERRERRIEAGKDVAPRDEPREAIARKLRQLPSQPLTEVPVDGAEFTVLVARRLPTGEVVLVGEIGDDVPLLERAARKLLERAQA